MLRTVVLDEIRRLEDEVKRRKASVDELDGRLKTARSETGKVKAERAGALPFPVVPRLVSTRPSSFAMATRNATWARAC